VLSQQYLAENDRPVELAQTVQLLANCSLGGLILIWFGCRLQARLSTKMRSLYFLSHRLNGHQAAPTYLTQSFAPASNVT
jgi:hypothetical protein